jgi:hypothetical protein
MPSKSGTQFPEHSQVSKNTVTKPSPMLKDEFVTSTTGKEAKD